MNKDTLDSSRGAYVLVLFLSKDVTISVGKLGNHTFQRGYYTYVGSALGKGATNLKNRVARHLKKSKRKFWHIDYLLANPNVAIEAVVAAKTQRDLECVLNGYLKDVLGATVLVRGFGASDCKNRCESHLLYFPEVRDMNCLVKELVDYCGSCAGVDSVEVDWLIS